MNEGIKRRSLALLLGTALMAVPVSAAFAGDDSGTTGSGGSVNTDGGGGSDAPGSLSMGGGEGPVGSDTSNPSQPCSPDPCGREG